MCARGGTTPLRAGSRPLSGIAAPRGKLRGRNAALRGNAAPVPVHPRWLWRAAHAAANADEAQEEDSFIFNHTLKKESERESARERARENEREFLLLGLPPPPPILPPSLPALPACEHDSAHPTLAGRPVTPAMPGLIRTPITPVLPFT